MNKLESQRNRLFRAVESSFRGLLPFRELNRQLVEAYVGPGYGQPSRARQADMIDLMNQTVDAYTMSLVANRPRVLISTDNMMLSYFAKQYQLALNNYIEQIGLEYKLRQWVLDAFFCVGVMKIHTADQGMIQIGQDSWIDPGKPYASNVSLDNFVYDMTATRYENIKYAGDMYRIPFDDLQGDIFDQTAVRDLQPNSKYGVDDGERLSRISRGYEVDHDELEPMIDLADIWVPREKKIYTYAVDSMYQMRMKGQPLAAMDDYDLPEGGPYPILGFNDVPENIMPTSPASHLDMLNRLVNNIMRKQAKRARNQKINHLYTPGAANSAKKLRGSADDEWIECTDPDEIQEHITGGVDQNAQAFMVGTMQLFDRMAGNLTAMLGLGAQASTVGQEELIHSAASKKEASMQYRVVDKTTLLIRNLGKMLWHDQFQTIRGVMPIDGAQGYQVDMTWTPHDREGEFTDYQFGIDVFSMPYQSPNQRIQALNSLLTQIYVPLSQMMQQQGGTFNLEQLTDIYADLLNLPQLRKVIQFTSAAPESGPPDADRTMPTATTRNYVRRNVPTGGTAASRASIEQQAWLNGGSANQAQTASMNRPGA